MRITLGEWLDEIELDPGDTDLVDVDRLLRAAGYRCSLVGECRVYWLPEGRWKPITLRNDIRVVPVSYLLQIVREVRGYLIIQGRLYDYA